MCSVGEECDCECHMGLVDHLMPCCHRCPHCNTNIRVYHFEDHKLECKKRFEDAKH